MKKNYKLVAMLLMVLCVSTFAFAESNTSAATMGTIKADADYYMDVDNYKNANIENMFLYTNLSNSNVNLGFAKQFENFYLGTWYIGDLLLPVTETNVTDNSNEYTEATYSRKTETDSTRKTTTLNGDNYFAALFGLKGGVALRLNSRVYLSGTKESYESTSITTTASENYSSTTKTEITTKDETTFEDNQVSNDDSYTYFGANFGGISFDVSKVTLKPHATISYRLYSNNSHSSTTKTTDSSNRKVSADQYLTENSVTTVANENTTKTPNELVFALGTLAEWGNKSGLFSTASLSFASTSKVGGNGVISESSDTFDYVDNVEAKNSYDTKTNTTTIREGYKNSTINIYGSYRFEYAASEKLTLGALFAPSIAMNTSCNGYEYNKIVSNTNSRWSDDEKATAKTQMDKQNKEAKEDALKDPLSTTKTTSILNSFAIGMKYQLKPSFAINLGFNTDLPTFNKYKTVYTEKHTDVDEGADAESTEDDTTTNVNNIQTNSDWYIYESASHSLKAGFVWDITENLSLDSVLNISVRPSLDSIWKSAMSLSVTYKM